MGCAPGIGNRLDGAEYILAGGTGEEAAETLEVCITLLAVAAPTVDIGSIVVALPDFNQRIANRIAVRVEYASAQPGDLAHGGRHAVVDDNQVIVCVERQVVGVERPFGLLRRANEFLGKCAGKGQYHRAQRQATQEEAAVLQEIWMVQIHGVLSVCGSQVRNCCQSPHDVFDKSRHFRSAVQGKTRVQIASRRPVESPNRSMPLTRSRSTMLRNRFVAGTPPTCT